MLLIKHFVCCGMVVHKNLLSLQLPLQTTATLLLNTKNHFTPLFFTLKLKKWLLEYNCTEVYMEFTGKYEISDLFKFDIVPNYIPCREIRALRELFRYRQKRIGPRSNE